MWNKKQLDRIEKKLDEILGQKAPGDLIWNGFEWVLVQFDTKEPFKTVSSAKAPKKRGKKLSEKEKKERKAAYMRKWYQNKKKVKEVTTKKK